MILHTRSHTSTSGSGTPRRVLLGALLLAMAITALPASVSAQYFGRNKVQYETFDFKILKTPHFDIHFYPEEGEAVEDAARMAERWYERFARLFQHEFEQPKPIILYADHPDFQQTNTLSGTLSEGLGGVTESLKNRVIMPLTGSYAATDHVLGHELVHAFQYNLAQGRSGAGIRGLSLLPLWVVEGIAEYLSVGREDPLTAMWLRDAIRRGEMPTLRQLSSGDIFPYRFGHAFWAFMGGLYGDDRIADIFRRALRIGWEPALSQVIGMSSDTLSVRWREAVEAEYLPLMAGRQAPGESGALLLAPSTGAGRQNVAPSVSPDGSLVAFLSERDLFGFDLFLADARTGEIRKKLVSANSDSHFDALRFIDSAGDWSPDGTQFVFSVFADGNNELAIVDVESGDVTDKIPLEGIGAITSPAWSPDGQFIAFSGLTGGISDIYTWDVVTGALIQHTDDKHADLQPTWSPDGSTIAFVSDRGAITDFETLEYSKPQIAFLDVASGRVSVLSIFGEVKHINPQYSPDGRSLYFVSDQDGFSDIYQYTFDSGDVRRITRLQTGVSGITGMSPTMSVARDAGTILFSVFDATEFHVYSLQAGEADAGGETISISSSPQAGRLLPPTEPERSSRIASYLADPLLGLVPTGTYLVENAIDYDASLSLDYLGQPYIGVGTDRFGAYASGGASAYFTDMLGNRTLGVMVLAQGTFKDIGGQAFFVNQAKRLNWGVSGGRIPYLQGYAFQTFNPDGTQSITEVLQRIYVSQASLMGAYPFSTTRRVEANIGVQRYSYDTEQRESVFDNGFFIGSIVTPLPSRPAVNLASVSVALVGDKSNSAFTGPVSGGRFRLEVGQSVGSVNFTSLVLDIRRYFSPNNSITFAARALHFGRYGNNLDIDRSTASIQPYFLGYETFIRGYAFESFQPGECAATQLEPGAVVGSCPGFDRLFGHRLGVVNLEMRIPLFGTERFGLINFPYLPTTIFTFADAGVAFNSFDDVRFEFVRSGGQRVPVFAVGAGARFNLFGFLILEAYRAYPFQRPDRGAHWGFVLAPAW
ncbi:MAG: PD40 domain-containing protein [Gemmatimonadetes bacterium]|nr:PD40 domain-containing protein [Gemmatimonadota bacterium]